MLTQTERACLVIADISGYTGYLAGSELDHAQDVLADLLEVVVGGLAPVLRLAKLEGDAVFTYAPEPEVDGSMLLDILENCYFAFRRRIQCQSPGCVAKRPAHQPRRDALPAQIGPHQHHGNPGHRPERQCRHRGRQHLPTIVA